MRVTRFKFFIKGDNEKKIELVVRKLKELGIGHIEVYSGDLKKTTTCKFERDDTGNIMNTNMGKFVGFVRDNMTHGEYVSEIKPLKEKTVESN